MTSRWRPIIGCSLQIQLTEMLASGAPGLLLGAPLAPISVSWTCLKQQIILSSSAGHATIVPYSCASPDVRVGLSPSSALKAPPYHGISCLHHPLKSSWDLSLFVKRCFADLLSTPLSHVMTDTLQKVAKTQNMKLLLLLEDHICVPLAKRKSSS